MLSQGPTIRLKRAGAPWGQEKKGKAVMSRLVPLTKRRKIINKTALEKTLSPTLQFVIQNGPQLFMTLKLLKNVI